MSKLSQSQIIAAVKEITISKLATSDAQANQATGKNAAEFMQQIYDKLVELNEKTNS